MTPQPETKQIVNVSLLLKISDVQTILNALNALPYMQVSQLIPSIMAQVQEQAQRAQARSVMKPNDSEEE